MSSFIGTNIVDDGLVFHYDMKNTHKSWKGKPTTSFFTNGHFQGGNKIPQESGSNAQNDIILKPNPGDSAWCLKQTMGVQATEYEIQVTGLQPSTTYVLSGWYAQDPDYTGDSRMFHSRFISASGAHNSLGSGIGTKIGDSVFIDGLDWSYRYETLTTPADATGAGYWYVGYQNLAYTGARYYTNLQLEEGTYPSPFVSGTRSNTEAIVDLTGNATITNNDVTYNQDGTFNFNGGTQRLSISNNIGPINNHFTISAWVKSYDVVPAQNILSMNGPYFMRIVSSKVRFNIYTNSEWLFKNGTTTLNSNQWYYFTMRWNGTTGYWDGFINDKQEFSTLKGGVLGGAGGVSSFYGYVGYTPQGGEQADFSGEIPHVKYYNRALSDAEILQNFEATRHLYGL